MKLKYIFIPLFILCVSIMFTSCDSFLEEKPKSNPQRLESAHQVKSTVNNLYKAGVVEFYGAGVYNGASIMFGSYLSGFYKNEYAGQEVIAQYAPELTIDGKNISRNMEEIYDKCYQGIGRANSVIKYAPLIQDFSFSEAERESQMAQARFFRALNYFHLVKFFGGVPLTTDSYAESLDNLYSPRASAQDIYKLIESDLLYALEGNRLPDEGYVSKHRVTKSLAETLLASVYLQMSGYPLQSNRYADAAKYAESAISRGKHNLLANGTTPQESAYNKLRTIDNTEEVMLAREHDDVIAKSNWVQISMPISQQGKGKYTLTSNASQVVEQLRNIYDPAKDLRIQEKQFFFTSFTYPAKGDKPAETVTFTEPSQWFYMDEDAYLNTAVSTKDFAIIRYPEVLLIAAEALVKSGGSKATAADYLAQVRARAYQVDKSALTPGLIALSDDKFVEEVWTEFTREFILEHKLWDQIQRTRKYPTTNSANKGVVTYINVIGAKNPLGATFQEKHLLWPISDNEIQRNPQLGPNAGY